MPKDKMIQELIEYLNEPGNRIEKYGIDKCGYKELIEHYKSGNSNYDKINKNISIKEFFNDVEEEYGFNGEKISSTIIDKISKHLVEYKDSKYKIYRVDDSAYARFKNDVRTFGEISKEKLYSLITMLLLKEEDINQLMKLYGISLNVASYNLDAAFVFFSIKYNYTLKKDQSPKSIDIEERIKILNEFIKCVNFTECYVENSMYRKIMNEEYGFIKGAYHE